MSKPPPKPFAFTRRQVMEEIAALSGGRCLLAFSRGKDSIAAWLELRESGLFKEIVPFHLNLIPVMRFIEESLDYFEDVFKTRIIRLPHVSFYRMLGNCVLQPPERIETIRRLGFDQCTRFTYDHVRRWLAEDLGWDEAATWTANGVRAADSPRRRIHIVKCRGRNHSQKQFYPVFDYRKADVMAVIERNGIRLPIDYEIFRPKPRTFDGIDWRFVGPLRKHLPKDYERLKFWFPLVEIDCLLHGGDGKDGE
jgi:3'-phosphoadenosine 5'-phosphosulfate sulfotransferase (PAPS reductase)/FAD synthetase